MKGSTASSAASAMNVESSEAPASHAAAVDVKKDAVTTSCADVVIMYWNDYIIVMLKSYSTYTMILRVCRALSTFVSHVGTMDVECRIRTYLRCWVWVRTIT